MRFSPDLAGMMFAASGTPRNNEVMRCGFALNEDVDIARLQQAVEDLYPRFPSFYLSLRRGFFQDFLEPLTHCNIIRPDDSQPCRPMPFAKHEPLLRILHGKRRITVELSHVLTDGGGALVFVQTLLARYLQLGGADMTHSDLPALDESPRPSELVDSYRASFTKQRGKPPTDRLACQYYQYRAPKTKDYIGVMHGEIPVGDALAQAKAHGLTLTDYLMAVYFYAFCQADPRARRSRKPIQLTIPVSLRKYYQSESLRNFSLYANMLLHPRARENYTLEDVIEAMHNQLAAASTKKEMHRRLCANVAMADNQFVRCVPNALKRRVIRLGHHMLGEGTSALSNLGAIALPPCLNEHVTSLEFTVSPSPCCRLQCMVYSCQDVLHIVFSSDTKQTDVQQTFFHTLQEQGLTVEVFS